MTPELNASNLSPAPAEDALLLSFPLIYNEKVSVPALTRAERLGAILRRPFISSYLVGQAVMDDFKDEWTNAENSVEKAELVSMCGLAGGGQVFERLKGPEVVGTTVATRAFKETLAHTHNTPLSIASAAIGLGLAIYVPQKIIGKSWVKTAELFPETYETVNNQWPKITEAVQDAIPGKEHRVAEGAAMFGLGTTAFIISSKAAEPKITTKDLSSIERRVTRRGSIFGGGVALVAFSALSYAHKLPAKAGQWAGDGSKFFVDKVSSPYWATVAIAGFTVLGGAYSQIKKRVTRFHPESLPEPTPLH